MLRLSYHYSVQEIVLDAWENALPSFPDDRMEAIFDLLIKHGMDPVINPVNDGFSLLSTCVLFGKRSLAEKYLALWLSWYDSPKQKLVLPRLLKWYDDPSSRWIGMRAFLKQKLTELTE